MCTRPPRTTAAAGGHRAVQRTSGRNAVGSPGLVEADGRLWLFYASPGDGDRPAVFGASSSEWTVWGDVGPVLEPELGERGLSEPWVVVSDDGLLLLFVRDCPGSEPSIGLATSFDGRTWSRHAAPLDLARRHHDAGSISGPSANHMGGRHLRVWYAAGDEGDTTGRCRLWSADLVGPPP